MLYRICLILCVALQLSSCATPLLDASGVAKFTAMSDEVLDVPVSARRLEDLKVDSTLDIVSEISVRLTSTSQVFEFDTGKSRVHLMKLPDESREHDLMVSLLYNTSPFGILPTVVLLDGQFNELSRLVMVPEKLQFALGTTIFEYMTVPPGQAKFVLFHTRRIDMGKEYKLNIDAGTVGRSYRRIVAPVGHFKIMVLKKGCRFMHCTLSVPVSP